jgi:hypothetical protein
MFRAREGGKGRQRELVEQEKKRKEKKRQKRG